MSEITVTLLVEEAQALLPQKGSEQSAADWNRRIGYAEDAHDKLRAELRKVDTTPMQGQEGLAV